MPLFALQRGKVENQTVFSLWWARPALELPACTFNMQALLNIAETSPSSAPEANRAVSPSWDHRWCSCLTPPSQPFWVTYPSAGDTPRLPARGSGSDLSRGAGPRRGPAQAKNSLQPAPKHQSLHPTADWPGAAVANDSPFSGETGRGRRRGDHTPRSWVPRNIPGLHGEGEAPREATASPQRASAAGLCRRFGFGRGESRGEADGGELGCGEARCPPFLHPLHPTGCTLLLPAPARARGEPSRSSHGSDLRPAVPPRFQPASRTPPGPSAGKGFGWLLAGCDRRVWLAVTVGQGLRVGSSA
ncbi:uncharacterized protein LOC116964807 [Tyto alba]|uniref:uncharacterized protein LOC116964807 n=1 Tax=Tyto alba TaxID=56313 RepID=UPI001C675D67|nr:uncharacterized protein LOC116964807 [Tyto alba]